MIWLIGSNGMLAREVSPILDERRIPYIGTGHEIDITDSYALSTFVDQCTSHIDWIVNCAAYTAVDKAEDEAELCRKVNTDGITNIAHIAKKIGARLIHISTDYVFDGNGNRPYLESDTTNPIGVYGLTKRDGEINALAINENSYIIRTSWLYGRYGKNFVLTMLKLMNERPSLSVVNDQRGCPTSAIDLANVIIDLISMTEKKINIPYGIYHYSGYGNISWYDFACSIYQKARTIGLLSNNCEIQACTSEQYPAKVRRPKYSVLDTLKIQQTLDLQIPLWETSLEIFLINIFQEEKGTHA